MKLIPAISIKDGRVAVADNGAYRYLKNAAGQYRSPVNLLREMDFPGEEVFVLDIDGLERNTPDLALVKRMAAHEDVWLDAGAGDADSMMDLFVSDATKVVMGTICMGSLEELGRALDISDNVIFSMGYDGGIISPDQRISGIGLEQMARELEGVGDVKAAMLFDLGGIKNRRGVDVGAIASIIGRFEEFYVSGHVSEEDIGALEAAGVHGIIMDFRTLEAHYDERT